MLTIGGGILIAIFVLVVGCIAFAIVTFPIQILVCHFEEKKWRDRPPVDDSFLG